MVVLCPTACQCGKSAWNKTSLAACCSPGSTSTLRDNVRAASQTTTSHQYFQVLSCVSKEKLRKTTYFLGYLDTACGQTMGCYAGVTACACTGRMLHRDALWDDDAWCTLQLAVCPWLWAPVGLCLLIFPTVAPSHRCPCETSGP